MTEGDRILMQSQSIEQLQNANQALRAKLRKALSVLRDLHRLDLTAKAEDVMNAILPEDMP